MAPESPRKCSITPGSLEVNKVPVVPQVAACRDLLVAMDNKVSRDLKDILPKAPEANMASRDPSNKGIRSSAKSLRVILNSNRCHRDILRNLKDTNSISNNNNK